MPQCILLNWTNMYCMYSVLREALSILYYKYRRGSIEYITTLLPAFLIFILAQIILGVNLYLVILGFEIYQTRPVKVIKSF